MVELSGVINLLEYRNMKLKTNDGRFTQGDLRRRINKVVRRVNTTSDSDATIADFISKCFTINGLVTTYNQLGIFGWDDMIRQMAEHENWERSKNKNG